jgi:hypothetical protein
MWIWPLFTASPACRWARSIQLRSVVSSTAEPSRWSKMPEDGEHLLQRLRHRHDARAASPGRDDFTFPLAASNGELASLEVHV